MAEEEADSKVLGSAEDQNPNSVNATIGSGIRGGDANNAAQSSAAVTNDDEREKTLEFADELMARGSKAAKEGDYSEATDCYSRALEIRVDKFGELAPECASAYYKYGCALLYKAQEEADPLGSMPKKEGEGSGKNAVEGESSAASATNNAEEGVEGKAEEGDSGSDVEAEDQPDGDEDESDLDLAWKMLDAARVIVEKDSFDTMEKVDILSALAEVALKREDVDTSLSDCLKALSMLERLVEPDSRLIAELNFRVCLCLEIGSKAQEAIPYCHKAISVCKSRVQRLSDEAKKLPGSAETSATSVTGPTVQQSSTIGYTETEIVTLTGFCGELEKKLENLLQQLMANPKSLLAEFLGEIMLGEIMSAKAKAMEKDAISAAISSSQMGTLTTGGHAESSTVLTGHTDGASAVTHLGVVGRGVKRVVMSSTTDSSPAKKPAVDSSKNGDEEIILRHKKSIRRAAEEDENRYDLLPLRAKAKGDCLVLYHFQTKDNPRVVLLPKECTRSGKGSYRVCEVGQGWLVWSSGYESFLFSPSDVENTYEIPLPYNCVEAYVKAGSLSASPCPSLEEYYLVVCWETLGKNDRRDRHVCCLSWPNGDREECTVTPVEVWAETLVYGWEKFKEESNGEQSDDKVLCTYGRAYNEGCTDFRLDEIFLNLELMWE